MRDAAWPHCHLRWDQPLQACWIRQASVYVSLTVALFCIAQVEAVCCEDVLLRKKHTRSRHSVERRIQAKSLPVSLPPTCVQQLVRQPKSVPH